MEIDRKKSIWVLARTRGEALVAIKCDNRFNMKRNPDLDLRHLSDGEWYRLAGLTNPQVLLVAGWERRKDADKLRPFVSPPRATLFHPQQDRPYVSTDHQQPR